MPPERAGYTVTVFLVDVSSSMGKTRTLEVQDSKGTPVTKEMTNLEWALQFVKLKVQDMIFNGRKTDQCGVIIFGSEETNNIVHTANGGYDNVVEYIPIAQPNAATIAKIDALQASTISGDPIDALIVGIETQGRYLAKKKSWTRKIVLVTDGESPIEIEDWEATTKKMDDHDISLTIVGVDFDDDELPYEEPGKGNVKRVNETFYHQLISSMKNGVIGTCALALRETAMPDIKQVRSVLMANVLRLGDVDTRGDEAIELFVKTSKCTSLARAKGWKKFGLRRPNLEDDMDMGDDGELATAKAAYAQLMMRTEYYIDRNAGNRDGEDDDDEKLLLENYDGDDGEPREPNVQNLEKAEKEELVRGFKYGTTYVPCPDGQFPKLPTRKGIDVCGFFPAKNFRRELSMDEIHYIWADPSSPQQQVALSSIVHALHEKNCMAIARWVSRDGMDPKMGVLVPITFDKVDCLIWSHMPFADDVRKYTFASLTKLVNKKGEEIVEHPYLPTDDQMEAMSKFVDAMDLVDAGEKDEEGNRLPWFSTLDSYNPSIHRVKQAMFHCAITNDVSSNPLPPPHPELLNYFTPPKRVLKRAKEPLEECKAVLKVKEVPKKVAKARKEGHVHAQEEDDNMLLLDRKQPSGTALTPTRKPSMNVTPASPSPSRKGKAPVRNIDDSDTEDDEDEADMLLDKKGSTPVAPRKENEPLPTPARSVSPEIDPGKAPGRIIGHTFPLKDFKKNIAQGDVVTKAVQDLGEVIVEVLMRPFASRRHAEMVECMKVLRTTCLEEDEIEAWNSFIRDLREQCLEKPGNSVFWKEIIEIGRHLSLISGKEARKEGGESKVTEKEATEFISHSLFQLENS